MHRMLTQPRRGQRIGDLWAARRGTTGIAFTMVLSLCLTFIGAAVDLKRAIDYRTMIQNWADLAVLAGAASYSNSAAYNWGLNVAQTFYGRAIRAQGTLSDVVDIPTQDFLVTTQQGTLSNGQTAYMVSITAHVTIKTTFMYPVMPSMRITVYATAANPVITPVFSAATFSSSSGDDDTIYAYAVPLTSDGAPEYDTLPSSSALYEIGRNNPSDPVPAGQTFTPVSATAPIAFALANITGGVTGYGTNSANCYNTWMNAYGVLSGTGSDSGASGSGQTNWFYTSYIPLGEGPAETTNYTYSWTGEVKSGSLCSAPQSISTTTSYPTTTNCMFEAAIYVAGSTSAANPPQNGSCFSPSAGPGAIYAAMNCQQLGGNTLAVWLNDMGGKTDNYKYTNVYFTVTCNSTAPSGATAITQVILLD